MNDHIFAQADKLQKKYGSRDPFELLEAMNVIVMFSDSYSRDGLKGFCTIQHRTKYVVINGKLSEAEQRVVAAHELGHIVVHNTDLKIGAFKDNDIYLATGKKEREANFFAADFLIADEDVIELIATIPSLFQMVGVLCGAHVARRIGYKKSAVLGLLCCGVGGVIPFFIQNFVLIFATRCLFGLGCGLISAVMLTMIVHFFTGDTRSTMIGLTGSVGGLGSALSSFIAGRLLVFGWHASFAVYFTAFAVMALIITMVPEAHIVSASHKRTGSSAKQGGWLSLCALTLLSFTSTLL